jgi:hypothetical protein
MELAFPGIIRIFSPAVPGSDVIDVQSNHIFKSLDSLIVHILAKVTYADHK